MSDNAELIDIAGIVSEHPAEALGRLVAINRDSLPERDAYYHDFLTLKANDKAYIDHTTDSIILRLLPYYEGEPLYPEVLYYAGRVYSDLGDYPTSLRYFQEALDHVPSDREHLRLKGHICSQTGRLLNTLRMYDSAIPYLKEVIQTNAELADTFNIAYNYQLIGDIYIRKKQPDSAQYFINIAQDYAKCLSDIEIADMQLYQAIVQYEKNNFDSALTLVRGLPDKVDPLSRNAALINASDIYLANGQKDTAYMYANELIHSTNINNVKNGYYNLFSPALIDSIPHDSLIHYIKHYYKEIDRFYNLNNSQQSIVQESMYNYQLHDRERAKAEHRNYMLIIIIIAAVSIALLTSTAVFYFRNRRNKLLLRLNETLNELFVIRSSVDEKGAVLSVENKIFNKNDLQQLRNYIHDNINYLAEKGNKYIVPIEFINSAIYQELLSLIEEKRTIPYDSTKWDVLENELLKFNPYFKQRLTLLAGRDLEDHECRLALLIKAGFIPSKCAILLGRTRGAITYQRNKLLKLLLNDEIEYSRLDDVIRCL